jgi:hypothetical protein
MHSINAHRIVMLDIDINGRIEEGFLAPVRNRGSIARSSEQCIPTSASRWSAFPPSLSTMSRKPVWQIG